MSLIIIQVSKPHKKNVFLDLSAIHNDIEHDEHICYTLLVKNGYIADLWIFLYPIS